MPFGEDDRAQSIQVGAILIFAILIVLLAVYQSSAIPNQNGQIEFDAYLAGSEDVTELRNAMLTASSSDTQQGVSVRTGTTYPGRVFFVNPPPAAGTLSTSDERSIALENVAASSREGNVDSYLESTGHALSYGTRTVEFAPAYDQRSFSPVRISSGFVYRAASDPIRLSTHPIVTDNRITLLTVAGDLQAAGQSVDVTVEPVSAYTRTISITNETDSPIVLTVPSTMSPATWEDILSAEMDSGHVTGVSEGPTADSVAISFEPGTTYELRTARLEVRERTNARTESTPPPRYVTTPDARTQRTDSNGRTKLTVEARDRYNNPVSNAVVTFDASGDRGTFEYESGSNVSDDQPVTVRTDESGRATVWYNATGGTYYLGTNSVTAFLGPTANTSLSTERTIDYSIENTVLPPGVSGGGGGDLSGEQAGRVLVVLADYETPEPDSSSITFTVNKTADVPVNVTGYRLDYADGLTSSGDVIEGPTAINQLAVDPGTDSNQSRPDSDDSPSAEEAKSPYFFSKNPITLNGSTHDVEVTFDRSFDSGLQGGETGGGPGNSGDLRSVFVSWSLYLEGGSTTTVTVHILL